MLNCANRPMSLAPAIIPVLTTSPFTISFLQCLVQLTRIVTPCIRTLHIFYHFCPSNGHHKLVIAAICFWLTVSEHKAWYYWNNSDKHHMLLLLGCPLLKQKPSSLLWTHSGQMSKISRLNCSKGHFPFLFQYWNNSFVNRKFMDLSPQFSSTFMSLCFLLLWESVIYFCFSDGIGQRTEIDLPFVSALPITSSPHEIFQHFSNVFSF